MKKLTIKDKHIAYHILKSKRNKPFYVIFSHGLNSNAGGRKALYLENFCAERDLNFIRFDNFGHGDSSGDFKKQHLGSYLLGLEAVLTELTEDSPVVLVGSSLGAWVSLLAAVKFPGKVKALLCISAAPDFTSSLEKNFTEGEKERMRAEGFIKVKGDSCEETCPISLDLVEGSRKFLLFSPSDFSDGNIIDINIPVTLVHGMKDKDVPYTVSLEISKRLRSEKVVVELIKDGDHRLSSDGDLEIIGNSLKRILHGLRI